MDLLMEYQTASTDRRSEIEAMLVREHRPLAIWCAKRYLKTLGKDDALQEAQIGLLLSIRRFKPQKGAWKTFAPMIIRHHLYGVWQKAKPPSQIESLDEMYEDPERRKELQEALTFADEGFGKVSFDGILKTLSQKLTRREYEILTRSIRGESLQVVADRLGISKQRAGQIEPQARRKAQWILSWLFDLEPATLFDG